jgi:CRISPR-associated protein Cas8a1/Csx13
MIKRDAHNDDGLQPTLVRRKARRQEPRKSVLQMRLYAPGMTAIHRAGLGGLACALCHIEQAVAAGNVSDAWVPGGPWEYNTPPWKIEDDGITLDFHGTSADRFLQRLFHLAFRIDRDGLIAFPGLYPNTPNLAIRAELHEAILLTFLQFGPHRKLDEAEQVTVELGDAQGRRMTKSLRKCSGYLHQALWEKIVDGKGRIKSKPCEVIGAYNPGAIIRHNAFKADSRITEFPETLLPLFFAPVGTLSLSANRDMGLLLIPEVRSLSEFLKFRPLVQPQTVSDFRVTNGADAVLQALLRLRTQDPERQLKLPAFDVMTFANTGWGTKQKARVAVMHLKAGQEAVVERFATVLKQLGPRLIAKYTDDSAKAKSGTPSGNSKEVFYADSALRPLIASNLAHGLVWYSGFSQMFASFDVEKRAIVERIPLERKGLFEMTTMPVSWDHAGESALVRSIHEALRNHLEASSAFNWGRRDRFFGEYERWRASLAGARTAVQFRNTLCNFLSRHGHNSTLTESWQEILAVINRDDWQLTRDLALLACASHSPNE